MRRNDDPDMPATESRPKRKQDPAKQTGKKAKRPKGARDSVTALAPPPITGFATSSKLELDYLRAQIAPLANRSNPVIAGPFLSEVGFELLYWIPLLRWATREFPGLAERLIMVSRGGTESWSRDVAGSYFDVLSRFSPEELAAGRASLKQRAATEFEMAVYAEVKKELGIGKADVIHPALLFNTNLRMLKLDQRAWVRSVRREKGRVEGFAAAYEPISPLADTVLDEVLPEDFVAVRFYFRGSFPDTPENRRFVTATLEALRGKTNVVLLNNRLELDDHHDFEPDPDHQVVTLDHLMTPENNLHVQTAAISRARAFVGTYGGLSYVAPFLGVPSLAFRSNLDHAHPWHLELAQEVFRSDHRWGSLVALLLEDLTLIDLLTGDLAFDQLPTGFGRS